MNLFFDWLLGFLGLFSSNKLEHFPNDLYNFHQTFAGQLEAVLYIVLNEIAKVFFWVFKGTKFSIFALKIASEVLSFEFPYRWYGLI